MSIMSILIYSSINSAIISMIVAFILAYDNPEDDFLPLFVVETLKGIPYTFVTSFIGLFLIFYYKSIINLIINLSVIGLCVVTVIAFIAVWIWLASLNHSNSSHSNDEEDEYIRYQEEMAEQERKAREAEQKRREYEDMLCYGYDGSAIVNARGRILGTTWSKDDEVTCFGTGYTIKSGNQIYTYRLNPETLSYENVGCIKVMEK